ncbi:MAG: Crp/Fnr family transcriptional regulator [Rickettsiaceae bacterium]|nr:Crp/Fnr family transcriptional regulator [Rickettsiaceae bacterium]
MIEMNPQEQESKNFFGKYYKLITSLQLFLGISTDSLYSILQHGQIRNFGKGTLLFLEGDQIESLYVVLEGTIKIFKGSESGEEAILQILKSGDPIMESTVFLDTNFTVSAETVENATLLSIPATIIREQVKSNHKLALNLITSIAEYSQELIRQAENIRLKSADERIGLFLLNLFWQQKGVSREVKLPYDKALIASYLDMRRETFSRVLKRLKAKGFKIENDTIVIPKLTSLCEYCDSSTAAKCPQYHTPYCPNKSAKKCMSIVK